MSVSPNLSKPVPAPGLPKRALGCRARPQTTVSHSMLLSASLAAAMMMAPLVEPGVAEAATNAERAAALEKRKDTLTEARAAAEASESDYASAKAEPSSYLDKVSSSLSLKIEPADSSVVSEPEAKSEVKSEQPGKAEPPAPSSGFFGLFRSEPEPTEKPQPPAPPLAATPPQPSQPAPLPPSPPQQNPFSSLAKPAPEAATSPEPTKPSPPLSPPAPAEPAKPLVLPAQDADESPAPERSGVFSFLPGFGKPSPPAEALKPAPPASAPPAAKAPDAFTPAPAPAPAPAPKEDAAQSRPWWERVDDLTSAVEDIKPAPAAKKEVPAASSKVEVSSKRAEQKAADSATQKLHSKQKKRKTNGAKLLASQLLMLGLFAGGSYALFAKSEQLDKLAASIQSALKNASASPKKALDEGST